MTQNTSPAEQFLNSVRESIRLVGETSANRAQVDTLAFAQWSRDLTFSKETVSEFWNKGLNEEQRKNSYSQTLFSALKAVFFSTKPEVMAIVEKYKAGNYAVGIQAVYRMARKPAAPRSTANQESKKRDATAKAAVTPGLSDHDRAVLVIQAIGEIEDRAELALIQEYLSDKLATHSESKAA